jgi:hypothetical protein
MTNHVALITTASVSDTGRHIPVLAPGLFSSGVSGNMMAASVDQNCTLTSTGGSAWAGTALTAGITYCISTTDNYYGMCVATSTTAFTMLGPWLNKLEQLSGQGQKPTGGAASTTIYGPSASGTKSPIFTSQRTVIEQINVHWNITANTTLSIVDPFGGLAYTTFVAQFATTPGTNILPYPIQFPMGKDGLKLDGPFHFTCSVGAQLTAAIYYRVTGGQYATGKFNPNTPT